MIILCVINWIATISQLATQRGDIDKETLQSLLHFEMNGNPTTDATLSQRYHQYK